MMQKEKISNNDRCTRAIKFRNATNWCL